MKTIFIPILQGVEARNILRTDIFKILTKQANIQIVLLVPNRQKLEYYRKEFHADNIKYEIVKSSKNSFLDKIFSRLKFYALKTESIEIKRKIRYEESRSKIRYMLSYFVNLILSRVFFRRLIKFLDLKFVKTKHFYELIKKNKPDLIISAHLFGDLESSLVRGAKIFGIKTVGLINSWDKFTARSIIRVVPDKLIVHNNIIKYEALKYADIKESNVKIVGVPHFDIYTTPARLSREEFFRKIGIPQDSRLILFAPIGKRTCDVDWELIEIFNELIKTNKIPSNTYFLVRFPPNDSVDLGDLSDKKNFIFESPGVRFSSKRGVDWDMNEEEIQHLKDTLNYIDILLTHISTLIIEAAIYDKPIICIGFDGKTERTLSKSATRFFKFTHCQPILKSGGVRVAKSIDELANFINLYLENPSLDREGRKRIVEEQCWKIDGMASQRFVDFIMKQLKD